MPLLILSLLCLLFSQRLWTQENLSEGFVIEDFYEKKDPSLLPYSKDLSSPVPHYEVSGAAATDNLQKSHSDKPDANQALLSFESTPSATIAGCVNAISGAFFDSQIDLLVPNAQPLIVQRSYCSSEKKWFFRHMPSLKTSSGQTSHLYAVYQDDTGASMGYRERNYYSGTNELTIPSRVFTEHGLTNCGSGEISGQTNWRNSSLHFITKEREQERFYVLRHGTHVDRYFFCGKPPSKEYKNKPPKGEFQLTYELHPNGNAIAYRYNLDNELDSIYALNRLESELGSLRITRESNKICKTMMWDSYSGSVSYLFDNKERLVGVSPSQGIRTLYKYDEKGHIKKKMLPKDRFLEVQYYSSGFEKGRVQKLLAPVGNDSTAVVTHTFHYIDGMTTVSCPNGSWFDYVYDNKTKKLSAIFHRDADHICLSAELFFWEPNDSPNVGNLRKRVLRGNDVRISRKLTYDNLDNIKTEKLKGNLTGLSEKDVYIKTFRSTDDGRNLPLEEDDGRKQIAFEYYPNSNLLKSRLTKAKGKILKREFFKYDDQGEVVEEIWDDGEGLDPDDLIAVTERHLKITTPSNVAPIGLPAEVEELYWDVHTKCYITLKKVVNQHTVQGKLLQQQHYGAE